MRFRPSGQITFVAPDLMLVHKWKLTSYPDFDAVPNRMLNKLAKKQEETTRSLQKIERGT